MQEAGDANFQELCTSPKVEREPTRGLEPLACLLRVRGRDSREECVGREGFVPRPVEEYMGWLMSRASHALGAALAEGLAPWA